MASTIQRETDNSPTCRRRRGVIMPLFALLLPVLLLLCAVAINISYFRLLKSEMKVANDATAHAAGRAMSIYQDVDQTINFARYAAGLNTVGSTTFSITPEQVVFGSSVRGAGGFGRYQFTEIPTSEVRTLHSRPNSVAIDASNTFPLLVQAIGNFQSLNLTDRSIATQVDRDIALVLDRSGSMLDYRDEAALNNQLYSLYRQGRISRTEYTNAVSYDTFSTNVVNRLTGEMKSYASDLHNHPNGLPRYCRWAYLIDGVDAFLDVLDGTDQDEYVTLATFATTATLNYNLSLDYGPIRNYVNGVIPNGSTAIGQGIQEAVPEIMNGALARPFASKTIVILTDGMNNQNPDPVSVVQNLVQQYNVTIHTVTFSPGADQSAMQQVAQVGGGRHYHSDNGDELIQIFQEIANNLPTILTQ